MRRQRERNGQPGGPFGTSDGGYEPFSATQAEAMTMAELSRLKQEQLALEREQKKEAAERLRLANEQVKLENDLTQALERSRMQYEREIDAATRLNEKTKERIDMQVRDSFMKGTLGGDDYKRYQIGADADRKLATIDPRTDNASELARRYVAERELALIQLRQSSEGFTQAVSDDLNHFRAEFADVVGQLPQEFQQIIPPVLAASGELREGMTADLAQIRTQTGFVSQGFVGLGSTVRATKEQIAKGLQEVEDAYMRAGFVIQRDAGVSRLRGAQTGGLLFGAGGYVEPTYLARGGPAGTDTIPAWLTPGEGVLSRTGMSALDRLNSGIASMGSSRGAPMVFNAPLVDARGAQFTDERAIDALADRVQQRLALLNTRWGGTA
jgi:hypothetical protein